MSKPGTAILHYTAPPVVGGVETLMLSHARLFLEAGYPLGIVVGRGDYSAFPPDVTWIEIPEIDSENPLVLEVGSELENGLVSPGFEELSGLVEDKLEPVVRTYDRMIVHNLFTKHFNLPLTAALHRLIDRKLIQHCIAWCHDFSWTSARSRKKLHPGYPWDLLRKYRPEITYVVVSKARQHELANLFDQHLDKIHVIYNGVDPGPLLGFSAQVLEIIHRLGILESDLVMLMPVRVTRAKNIEYAMRVIAELKKLGSRCKLVITGPPDPHDENSMDYFNELKSMRDHLDLERSIHFIYESGPVSRKPILLDQREVGEFYRICDLVFMPSHSEGFGMPVLEAGLAGVPVLCTEVPAAVEIAGNDVRTFDESLDPAVLANLILEWMMNYNQHRLRRRIKQDYTWEAIFQGDIEPLLVA